MSATPNDPIASLEAAIAALEAQRPLLGDATIELATAPLRQQLAALLEKTRVSSSLAGERKFVTVMFADMLALRHSPKKSTQSRCAA